MKTLGGVGLAETEIGWLLSTTYGTLVALKYHLWIGVESGGNRTHDLGVITFVSHVDRSSTTELTEALIWWGGGGGAT